MLTNINHLITNFAYALAARDLWTTSFAIILSDGLLVVAFCLYVFIMLPLRRSGAYVRTVFHDILPAVVTAIVGFLLKTVFPSPRPYVVLHLTPLVPATDPFASFPSLHSAIIAAFATTLFFAHRRLGKVIAWMVPLVMLGRIAVGVHWFSDVVAGALLGIAIALLFQQYAARKHPRAVV